MNRKSTELVLKLHQLERTYRTQSSSLRVLRGVDFTLHAGEAVALVAPSGSGKSTLLHLAGLLEYPDAGTVEIMGRDTTKLLEIERTKLRGETIGFVYQFHHLLPEFSALENLILPQMIIGTHRKAAIERGRELLEQMGLAQRHDHRPAQLSGGEQQRVAIARALANRPQLILADEPTGNLDPDTAREVTQRLISEVARASVAALVATHNLELAASLKRIVMLKEGLLVEAKVRDGKLVVLE